MTISRLLEICAISFSINYTQSNLCPHSRTHTYTQEVSFQRVLRPTVGTMKTSLVMSLFATGATAFVPVAPVLSGRSVVSSRQTTVPVSRSDVRMGLSPTLAANFPRDFANVSAECETSTALLSYAMPLLEVDVVECQIGNLWGVRSSPSSWHAQLGIMLSRLRTY